MYTLSYQKLLPRGNRMDVPFLRDHVSRDFSSTPTKRHCYLHMKQAIASLWASGSSKY